jgi:hypothetical protein
VTLRTHAHACTHVTLTVKAHRVLGDALLALLPFAGAITIGGLVCRPPRSTIPVRCVCRAMRSCRRMCRCGPGPPQPPGRVLFMHPLVTAGRISYALSHLVQPSQPNPSQAQGRTGGHRIGRTVSMLALHHMRLTAAYFNCNSDSDCNYAGCVSFCPRLLPQFLSCLPHQARYP